jgi:hypothetical protein
MFDEWSFCCWSPAAWARRHWLQVRLAAAPLGSPPVSPAQSRRRGRYAGAERLAQIDGRLRLPWTSARRGALGDGSRAACVSARGGHHPPELEDHPRWTAGGCPLALPELGLSCHFSTRPRAGRNLEAQARSDTASPRLANRLKRRRRRGFRGAVEGRRELAAGARRRRCSRRTPGAALCHPAGDFPATQLPRGRWRVGLGAPVRSDTASARATRLRHAVSQACTGVARPGAR